jgi:hypothetical protein
MLSVSKSVIEERNTVINKVMMRRGRRRNLKCGGNYKPEHMVDIVVCATPQQEGRKL